MLLDHNSMNRTTLERSFSSTKLLIKQHSQRYEALDSDNSGFEPAASSSILTAIRSSTVSFSSDSRMTGGSDTLAARILRSSSNDMGLQDLSNRGLLDMMRKRCSRRVCSRPFQCSHKLCSPRPAILKSTRHRRHLANPSTTRLFQGKPTKVPTTPETKNDGFSVLIARFRPANTQHNSHSTTIQAKPKNLKNLQKKCLSLIISSTLYTFFYHLKLKPLTRSFESSYQALMWRQQQTKSPQKERRFFLQTQTAHQTPLPHDDSPHQRCSQIQNVVEKKSHHHGERRELDPVLAALPSTCPGNPRQREHPVSLAGPN